VLAPLFHLLLLHDAKLHQSLVRNAGTDHHLPWRPARTAPTPCSSSSFLTGLPALRAPPPCPQLARPDAALGSSADCVPLPVVLVAVRAKLLWSAVSVPRAQIDMASCLACPRSVASHSVFSTLPCRRTPAPSTFSSVPCPWLRARASLFGCRRASSSVGLASPCCPNRASPRSWSCSSSSPTLCCRFDHRRCCVPRCVLDGCRLMYPSTRACPWLALALACLLVVTATHSLFVHQASRVLVFAVELLNPSSLVRDFVVARALTGFVSLPAHSRLDLVVIPCIIKKSQESGEDEASSVIFPKCSTQGRNQNPCRVRG
jgi:hypothetical protein